MHITLKVSHFYDWVMLPSGTVPSQADHDARIVMSAGREATFVDGQVIDGEERWRGKVLLPMPDHAADDGHHVAIPESQLLAYETPNRDGTHQMTRSQKVLYHLQKTQFGTHVLPIHVLDVLVSDEEEPSRTDVERFLKTYLGIGDK